MAIIRPCADLRNNYNEISRICHETNEPVFITKNGYNDLVILSNEAYESMEETAEERVDRLLSEKFDKHYADFEEFKSDIIRNVELAMKEVEEGKYIPMEQFMTEMEKISYKWRHIRLIGLVER